ncbi:MAG: acyl-CoA dehydrogenase family protein [Atribacterota bacterium]
MDFELNENEKMLQNMVREFAQKEIGPLVEKLDKEPYFPIDIIKRFGELGFIGIFVPEQYGGNDMGHLARIITIEEIAKVYAPLAFFFQADQLPLYAILSKGTEEQKTKYLPKLCSGEFIGAMAVTEPSGGSDPNAAQTRAEWDGNKWIINGRKAFITLAEVADVCVFTAKTDKGFTTFIVDRGTDGFNIGHRETHAGLKAIPVSEVTFSNCFIPKENLLGVEGKGLGATIATVGAIGRTAAAAMALGLSENVYEIAYKYAKERILYGKPIFELEPIKYELAQMRFIIESGRLLTYKMAWLQDKGKSPRELAEDIAMAKYVTSEGAIKVCSDAIHLLGAYGTTEEYHIINRLHDAYDLIPAGGTSDIMLLTMVN